MKRHPFLDGMRFVAYALAPIALFVAAYHLLRYSNVGSVAKPGFTREEQVSQITDAFRLYGQAFDRRFPDHDEFRGDVLMAEVVRKLDLPNLAGHSPRWGFSP